MTASNGIIILIIDDSNDIFQYVIAEVNITCYLDILNQLKQNVKGALIVAILHI